MLTFFSSTKITIRVIKSVLECLLVPIKAIKVIVMVTIKFKCRISVLRERKKKVVQKQNIERVGGDGVNQARGCNE